MKQLLNVITLTFVILFTNIIFVNATDYKTTLKEVSNNNAHLMCEYTASDTKDGVRIYYYPVNKSSSPYDYGRWEIFYKTGDSFIPIAYNNSGSFNEVFTSSKKIHYNQENNFLTMESAFECTNHATIDTTRLNEICLFDSGTCGDKFKRKKLTLFKNTTTMYSKIDNYVNDQINRLNVDDLSYDVTSIIIEHTKTYVKDTFFKNTNTPAFITKYINDLTSSDNDSFKLHVAEKTAELQKVLEQKKEANEITEDDYKNKTENLSNLNSSLGNSNTSNDEGGVKVCRELIPGAVRTTLTNILDFIKYIGPILVAIFTILELMKTATNGDAGELKKNANHFAKRLVAAILLFFVPLFVSMLFRFISTTDMFNPCTTTSTVDMSLLESDIDTSNMGGLDSSKVEALNVGYPNTVVENMAAFIAMESDGKFINQLMVGAVFINNMYATGIISKPEDITTTTMCRMFTHRNAYQDKNFLCNLTFDKFKTRRGAITESQINQRMIAAKLVLSQKFTIPKNIIYQTSYSNLKNSKGIAWGSIGSIYYGRGQYEPSVAKSDVYGNEVSVVFSSYSDKATELYNTYIKNSGSSNAGTTTKNERKSKIVFIGDSRTVQMYAYFSGNWTTANYSQGGVHKINNDYYVAEGSQGIKWMKSTGIPAASKYFDSDTAIVILMGVNDVKSKSKAAEYIEYINNNATSWTSNGSTLYFVSVNPCNGSYSSLEPNIQEFNTKLKTNLSGSVTYLDLYSYLKTNGFKTTDGLHYNGQTSKTIYNYIKDRV